MSDMFTKDPNKLRCPKCSGIVDSGHTWEAVKRITKNGLSCEHCGVALNKVSKNHWSVLPLPIFFIIDFFADLQESYSTGLGFLALAITFALIARETASTKLEVKDEDKLG
jgi:hypothetical protein